MLSMAAAPTGTPKGPFVLLVEDEDSLRQALAQKLEAENFRVVHAASVTEALNKARNQRFACVLIDWKLGPSTAEDIISEIRDNPNSENFKTPLAVVSGHLDRFVIEVIRTKINKVFVKPFKTQVLLDWVREVTGFKKAA